MMEWYLAGPLLLLLLFLPIYEEKVGRKIGSKIGRISSGGIIEICQKPGV